jgi:hypothetical protein
MWPGSGGGGGSSGGGGKKGGGSSCLVAVPVVAVLLPLVLLYAAARWLLNFPTVPLCGPDGERQHAGPAGPVRDGDLGRTRT